LRFFQLPQRRGSDCLFDKGNWRNSVLKRTGPAEAKRNIWGFHLPDKDFNNPSTGQVSGMFMLGWVVMFF